MVSVAFNNGEYRWIDFKRLFEQWNVKEESFQSQLLDTEKFNSVRVHEGTLQWPLVKKTIALKNGQTFDVLFDVDPVLMYNESTRDDLRNERYNIGNLLKTVRLSAGLTQAELADRSGTTKNYISRIENNKSDIEYGTLKKIIEIGLGKELVVVVR